MNHASNIGFGFWRTRPANEINMALGELPVAEKVSIVARREDGGEVGTGKFKAIIVNGQVIDVPTKHYVLKQHEDVFRPLVEGITVSGLQDWNFMLWADNRRANLVVMVGEATDGVKFGFKATNSFDRSTTIDYGLRALTKNQTVEVVEREHVLVWGYRQVCSNGMVMRVPLKTCKYLDTELVTKVKELLTMNEKIRHYGKDIDAKLECVQFLVEGMLLLRNPINRMIVDAQNHTLNREQAKAFLDKYVGRRRLDRYLELYGREEQTLWGLYNSVTFLASHQEEGLTHTARQGLLMKAATMLEEELMPKATVGGEQR